MKDLIEALTIFAKYTDARSPTSCEHDTLYVQVDPAIVNDEDKAKLNGLGFHADTEDLQNFYSFRFGSC
jgi:hypothetical protein